MTNKTRAEKLAEELQARKTEITGEKPSTVRTVKQPEVTGMDKLEQRRAALRKLHDFRGGVLS
ncbi:hypothetical protein MASR1M60_14120 [Rhodocyclaceae bacterium]